jgi:beta-galactosidase
VTGYGYAPSWGESQEEAWGGINVSAGQGILTSPFFSGGWTWTGFDYKGEPTPYVWPDINSHFGIPDMASFAKDRMYWYKAWFQQPTPVPELYIFPHWNWNAGDSVDVWAYSNADAVELFLYAQGAACVSQGVQYMPQYAHVQWTGLTFTPGSIYAQAYWNTSGLTTPVAV